MNVFTKIKNRLARNVSLFKHGLSSTTQKENFTRDEIKAIAEYRKTIKVYDAFIFFNELETLEIRLNILDPYVDLFVIVECTETFSGLPKKLYFKENAELFEKFRHKIIHYVIDDSPQFQDFWSRESFQRESIKKALVGLNDNDFCYISDLDEIWNPHTIVDYRIDTVYKFHQKMYAYYLNNRSSEKWAGTFATSYRRIKNDCLNDMRDAAKTTYTYIHNGGWHFTNQGGVERIKTKVESYSHSEFNTSEIKDNVDKKMRENKDFVGRKFRFWIDESDLPEYLLSHKEKYRAFFR